MRTLLFALTTLGATAAAAQTVKYQPKPIKVDPNAVRPQPTTTPTTPTPVQPTDDITGGLATWRRPAGDSPEPSGLAGEIRMIDPATRVSHITRAYVVESGIPAWTYASLTMVFKHKRTGRLVRQACDAISCKLKTPGFEHRVTLAAGDRPTHVSYEITFQHDTAFQEDPRPTTTAGITIRYNPNEWRIEALQLTHLDSMQCNDAIPARRCVYKTFSSTPWTATQR
ncbi:MAG: hypothetical protein SFX73_01020 [Kofleriaceae bacterium]|nr:hypothetical protein [Kofleriaceae bacterium]